MPEELTSSTIEVCEMFDISKTTLFRWEREGKLGHIRRDERDRRVFTRQNLEKVCYQKIRKRYEKIEDRNQDLNRQEFLELEHLKSVDKFLTGDLTGLEELKHYDYNEARLHPSHIKRLLKFALREFHPYNEIFYDVIDVINTVFAATR